MMKKRLQRLFRSVVFGVAAGGLLLLAPMELRAQSLADYTAVPPFINEAASPLVMLVMGRDHKLYYEAYDDASDIDGDGVLDIGYDHGIEYYGYFDSYKCYTYGSGLYSPVSVTTDMFCSSGQWSGNVLNWLTMSRMDAVRKVLYGGHRSTDTTSQTVLERAYIPQDAHSWGKELTGRLCNSGTNYGRNCSTNADCDAGWTCVDKSTELIGIAAATGPTTCTATAVTTPWDAAGKILVTRYTHASSKTCGGNSNNHANLVASYEPEKMMSGTTGLFYAADFNDPELDPTTDHHGSNYNIFAVTEFEVSSGEGGNWEFAIDGDDGVEVEVDGQVVATYYGCHGAANNQSHNGSINLGANAWYKIIVRHFEDGGGEGVRVWYKKPSDASWSIFGDTTLNLRAPTIAAGNECAVQTTNFIEFGTPSTGTVTSGAQSHHLFCSTTLSDGGTPIMRMLTDQTTRIWEWASKERPVCDNSLGTPTDYTVRVEACDSTVGLEARCKPYISGSTGVTTYKPTGLLQKYGEGTTKVCSKGLQACNTDADCSSGDGVCTYAANIYFGLLTGSYENNLSGGVIRKNFRSILDEIDRDTGILKTTLNTDGNIIQTLERLKVVNFDYGSHAYTCGWITDRAINEGECLMWGNPVGEMLYESTRYFAGKTSETSSFLYSSATDGGLTLPKLAGTDWRSPYGTFPRCSKPFNLVMSDINPSYDSDTVPGTAFGSYSGDLTGLDAAGLAATITATETLAGTNGFVGESGGTNDFMCTAKSISGLDNIRGLCPEEPTKQGSYYSASVAYYGREKLEVCSGDGVTACVSDTDCSTAGGTCGDRSVSTYSVALSSPIPKIDVNVGGTKVTMVPVGKSADGCLNVGPSCASKCTLSYDVNTGLSITNCAADAYCPSNTIVDVYVDTLRDDYGRFRINFEDVEQGADHDMDAIVEYEFCIGSSCTPAVASNQIKVTLTSTYAAGCIDQAMGFVISGTSADGSYLVVRDVDSASTDPGGASMPTTWEKTFTADATSTAASLLENPLWFAAKWGGFKDADVSTDAGYELPDDPGEWDRNGDGVPDTYFFVANPLELEKQLEAAFTAILSRASSGTSVSVLSTTGDGEGAVYQAYFLPEIQVQGDPVPRTWLGHIHGLFIDRYGNLREDTDQDGVLNLSADHIIAMRYDSNQGTLVTTYTDAGLGVKGTAVKTDVTLEGLTPLFDAGIQLWKQPSTSRGIFTTLNGSDLTGLTVSGSLGNFHDGNAAALQPYLRAADATEAQDIINYVRGNDIPGYRKRLMPYDLDKDGLFSGAAEAPKVWKLGDIVHSTPTTVSVPSNNFDRIYNDATYWEFVSRHRLRRNVVYVGANDGMMHAFNAGYFDTKNPDSSNNGGYCIGGDGNNDGVISDSECAGVVGDPALGDELWAFIPRALLPQLKWMTQTDYQHVYYVDQSPRVIDVRIFDEEAACATSKTDPGCYHPYGWGTILIGGLRMGGKPIVDGGGTTWASEYFAIDITDPDITQLLWSFTDADLGLTMSKPAVGRFCDAATGNTCTWMAVFGSGPTDYDSDSNLIGYQPGHVYILDLGSGADGVVASWVDGTNFAKISTGATNGFLAEPTLVDANRDYDVDTIYLGQNADSAGVKDARILRIPTPDNVISTLASATPTVVVDVNTISGGSDVAKRITAAPAVSLDERGRLWVYFGTGQYYGSFDKNQNDTGAFYAVRDLCWSGSCTTEYTSLLDVSAAVVDTNQSTFVTTVSNVTDDCDTGNPVTTWEELLQAADTCEGWMVQFSDGSIETTDYGGATLSHAGERVVSKPGVVGGLVVWGTFMPGGDLCSAAGQSNLYAVNYTTGTANFDYSFTEQEGSGDSTVGRVKYIGEGMPSSPKMQIGEKAGTSGTGGGMVTANIQASTGEIIQIKNNPVISLKRGFSGAVSGKNLK